MIQATIINKVISGLLLLSFHFDKTNIYMKLRLEIIIS